MTERILHTDGAALAFFVATLAVGGFWPLQSALRALRTRSRLTISTLLVVAAIGAITLGIIGEAALLVVVFFHWASYSRTTRRTEHGGPLRR